MTTEATELDEISGDSEEIPDATAAPAAPTTYSAMLEQFEASETWLGPADLPLLFHARMLCKQLDEKMSAGGDVKAAYWSNYLQVVERIEKRRPKPAGSPKPAGGDGLEPKGEQASLFETMDD